MFQRHTTDDLAAWLDGELAGTLRARVEDHLEKCEQCRAELEHVRTGKAALQCLSLVSAPEGLWNAIERAADSRPNPWLRSPAIWRFAAVVFLISVAAGLYRAYSRLSGGEWEVVSLAGSPMAGTRQLAGAQKVRSGHWIETDESSRARIMVGQIGSVDVQPGTSVRLVSTGDSGHRLSLANGAITARISAPPRLFFVETPAGTAIDLGCEYEMNCDRYGTGRLRVTSGWVSLEWTGRESLVPAGACCRMRVGQGPGTPWFEDAQPRLVQALERFDIKAEVPEALAIILAEARVRDTLTLWHLLSRVDAGDRGRLYDRMAALAPPPGGVTREAVMKLESHVLERWKNELAWIW